MIQKGKSNQEISDEIGITVSAVQLIRLDGRMIYFLAPCLMTLTAVFLVAYIRAPGDIETSEIWALLVGAAVTLIMLVTVVWRIFAGRKFKSK